MITKKLKLAAAILCLAWTTQVASANDDVTDKTDAAQRIEQEPRLAFVARKLGKELEVFDDGMFISPNLNGGLFSKKVPIDEIYKYLVDDCQNQGETKGDPNSAFTTHLGERWSEFYPVNKSSKKLADYLFSRGITPMEKAESAANTILWQGGGAMVSFSNEWFIETVQKRRNIKTLGYPRTATPFVCVARQNGYDRNIVFAAGFVGTLGSNDLYFVYIPQIYFSKLNQDNFDYHGSEAFLASATKANEYFKKEAQKVVSYSYSSDVGLIRAVFFKPNNSSYLGGAIHISFVNSTKKPILFNLQSITSVMFGDTEYAIVYESINGKSLSGISSSSLLSGCSQVNGNSEVIINPGSNCKVSISDIKIPGIFDFPNKIVQMTIMSQAVNLSPVMQGDKIR